MKCSYCGEEITEEFKIPDSDYVYVFAAIPEENLYCEYGYDEDNWQWN